MKTVCVFCKIQMLTSGGYFSWYMFDLEGYGCIYISNILGKKNSNKIQQKNQNRTNKQAKAQSQRQLLAEDETGGCSCLSRASVGSGMSWRASCAQFNPGRGVCRARCRKPFHQRRAAVTGRQLSLDPPPGLQGAVSLLLSLRRRTPIAGEFCAIWPWTRNFLIVLGKLTYKLSLCTYDTEWASLKYRVLMCCGFTY